MSRDVDNTDRQWPTNQWHPAYDSITDWLNDEAPPADTATRDIDDIVRALTPIVDELNQWLRNRDTPAA